MKGERRQLTVLFCDLVGSTSYSVEHALEDYLEIINSFKSLCSAAEDEFDGYIARFIGDGALFYFGYPYSQEGDAERAVHAAMSIIESIQKTPVKILGEKLFLEVRIGVATGTVLVEENNGSGLAVGDIPNLAARIQSLAPPNSILISDKTKKSLGRTFKCKAFDCHEVAGFPKKQNIWLVEREVILPHRFLALRGSISTPFVGREDETRDLLEICQRSREDRSVQIIEIIGEAGIGKSRLVSNFLKQLSKDTYVLVFNCSPHHTNSTLYPVIDQALRAARIYPKDGILTKAKKLKRFLSYSSTQAEKVLPAYMKLLGFTKNFEDLSSIEFRTIILASLVDRLRVLAKSYNVVIVCEDMHWADPTTKELVSSSFSEMRGLPVTMALTTRQRMYSGQNPSDESSEIVQAIEVSRLHSSDSQSMIQSMFGQFNLSSETIYSIEEKTDGIPLFIEDFTHLIKLKCQSDQEVTKQLSTNGLVPANLQDALLERITRLKVGKPLIQVASVIGRVSSIELLELIIEEEHCQVRKAIEELISHALILEDDYRNNSLLVFRHALVLDVTYSTLLRGQKHKLHRKVADTIQAHNPEEVLRHPQILGYHYEMASDYEQALKWISVSVEQSISNHAIEEARILINKFAELIVRTENNDMWTEKITKYKARISETVSPLQG